jgi:uncharacterized protein YdiU (UPF0061 family)
MMNTDNMALAGETIDYGPCAFMDAYDPATVFSSIDHGGRYAFGNQPQIAHWNLARFAETLLPLLHSHQEEALRLAQEAIASFGETFQRHWLAGMRAKLGLFTEEDEDLALVHALLAWMHHSHADYTNTLRDMASEAETDALARRDAEFNQWLARWRGRLGRQPQSPREVLRLMRARNPAVIARNHRVEEALAAVVERSDYTVMERLLAVLRHPFDDPAANGYYRMPPPPSERSYKTYCGT